MPKVSIIIPVFNVEQYLKTTLDSVVGQTMRDIEAVVVDDGSTDASGKLAREYAARDGRVRLITLEKNEGSSRARKRGIEEATGEYMLFLDGDDTLTPDACEVAYRAMVRRPADILQFPENIINVSGLNKTEVWDLKEFLHPHVGRIKSERLISNCFERHDFSWTMHGKLFRASVLRQACAKMANAHIVMADDVYSFFIILYYARSYRGIKGAGLYNYYIGRGVTGRNHIDLKTFRKYCAQGLVVRLIRQFLDQEGAYHAYENAYRTVHDNLLRNCVYNWMLLKEGERSRAFDELALLWGYVDTISMMAELLRTEKVMVADGVYAAASLKNTRKHIGTIATFYYRAHNGGTERIMAKLIEIWQGMGYRVVLFTEEEPHENDYPVGEQVVRVVLPAGIQSKSYTNRAVALDEALKKHDVDMMVYHAWFNEIALWDALIVKSQGIPFVMYAHSISQFPLIFSSQYYYEMPYVFRVFDAVLTLSRVDKQYWGYFCDNVQWVTNPICFDVGAQKTSSLAGANLLWVGRLEPLKNYRDLIDVMWRVAQEHPEARLTVLGDAEKSKDMAAFLKEIKEKELDGHITVTGYQSHVAPYYSNASLFIMTSAVEGFPTVLVESKAFGLPCVAYDLPYLEMFRDGEGISKVPYGDKKAMAAKIVQLLKDDKLRSNEGRAAGRSLSKYDGVDHAAVWKKIIGSVTEARGDRAHRYISEEKETGRILIETSHIYSRMGIDALYSNIRMFRMLQRLYVSAGGRMLMWLPRKARRFLKLGHRVYRTTMKRMGRALRG
jgi:glycosyltransferase involved in cell wall biosynthesis